MTRQSIKAQIRDKGIEGAMRVKKGTLTPKMRKFAEQVALGSTGSDAYRVAYNAKGKPKTVGNHASLLKRHDGIRLEIERIERANHLAALHSAEGLRSIVISTLAEIATNPDSKDAVRVQAVRSIGQLVGVDAFRETKRIEHVKDASAIRAQILDQLRTITVSGDDSSSIDALLGELGGENSQDVDPHHAPTTPNAERDSGSHEHSIPLEPSQDFVEYTPTPQFTEVDSNPPSPSETTPMSFENEDGGGNIFLETEDVVHGNIAK